MLRRQARQRREFLYQRAGEAREQATNDRKRKSSNSQSLDDMTKAMAGAADDADPGASGVDTGAPSESFDSEYAFAGATEPKVLVTTSHDPSSKLVQFLKEVKLLIPNADRMNRGGNTVRQLIDTCRAEGFTDLIVLQEHRGVPDGLVVSHMPYGPTAYFGLHNVVMRHDIPRVAPISEAYPHLIVHNLTTKIGGRVGTILKHLFPTAKPDSRRIVSLINKDDVISFRHHVYSRDQGSVHLMEAGPRFELKLYQIKLGTIEQTEVENEWVLRPYMNSTRKGKRALS